jgi:hypothetical protein
VVPKTKISSEKKAGGWGERYGSEFKVQYHHPQPPKKTKISLWSQMRWFKSQVWYLMTVYKLEQFTKLTFAFVFSSVKGGYSVLL